MRKNRKCNLNTKKIILIITLTIMLPSLTLTVSAEEFVRAAFGQRQSSAALEKAEHHSARALRDRTVFERAVIDHLPFRVLALPNGQAIAHGTDDVGSSVRQKPVSITEPEATATGDDCYYLYVPENTAKCRQSLCGELCTGFIYLFAENFYKFAL
ncbi:MAG TPA: hypothetical protein VF604_04250 [Pyrinomonadaceae bacterium]